MRKEKSIISVPKKSPTTSQAPLPSSEDGTPLMISRSDLVAAINSELKDYFFDGVSPTLGQYAIDHIIGGILERVTAVRPAVNS